MSFFTQARAPRLYLAGAGDPGWLAYVLPSGATPPGDGIELAQAYTSLGTFVFATTAPPLPDRAAEDAVVADVDAVLASIAPNRAVLWAYDPARPAPETVVAMGLADDGSAVASLLTAPLTSTLTFSVGVPAALTLPDGSATLQIAATGSNQIKLDGTTLSEPVAVPAATLAFAGPRRGTFAFPVSIKRATLVNELSMGFQLLAPVVDPVRDAIGESLPLADGINPSPGDLLGFIASIDPTDPYNAVLPDRTAFTFTGLDDDGTQTELLSHFRTPFGAPVTLFPVGGPLDANPDAARLVLNDGPLDDRKVRSFLLAPAGDFVLSADPGPDGGCALICGLQGTEFVAFQPRVAGGYAGDRLRFVARRPAFAPGYPPEPASPVGPPVDPGAPLLDDTFVTSWATVARAPGAPGDIPYVSQPKGAPLYGRDEQVHAAHPTLLGARSPAVRLPAGVFFPMVPYQGAQPNGGGGGGGAFTAEQAAAFEAQVVAPTRRVLIGAATPAASPDHAMNGGAANGGAYNTTTPAGLLVSVAADGTWTKVLLGRVPPAELRFCNPKAALQQAFQTSSVFLVGANATQLGALSGEGTGDCGAGAAFFNQLGIGGWELRADVGQDNRYGDYTNVLIVKGRRGALWDPTSDATRRASLVSSPDLWTQGAQFAAPSDLVPDPDDPSRRVPGTPDPTEMVILSQWLQDYFDAAAGDPDTEYFARFNAIARDPGWTGILVLRATIARVPQDLAGIMAGIAAPERFFAHHFAVEISQVKNDPAAADVEVEGTSSVFGLIHYVDPQYVPPAAGAAPQPVPPAAGADYDFRVLTLKALFENTAVRSFQSYAQLTLGRLFGMKVARMGAGGNPYATVVLRGSYQDNGGKPVYSLGTTATSTFYFDSNVVAKIEVDSATMSTRSAGSTAPPAADAVSWFALAGFLDFRVVTGRMEGPADAKTPGFVLALADPDALSTLSLRFDAGLDPATAGDTASYVVSGGLSVAKAALGTDGQTVTLTLSGPADPGSTTVTVSGVKTAAGADLLPPLTRTVTSTGFDLFSFGSDAGRDDPRRGLAFSGLGVEMRYPPATPAQRTFRFAPGEIRFDPATSTPRAGSLFVNFALTLQGLATGTKDVTPASTGFLNVVTDATLAGVDGGEWFGLRYQMDMGTPGALAGNVGLTSQLLTAWAPDSTGAGRYRAMLGVQLPGTGGGAKLISLQNVLKLSIGQVRLTLDRDRGSFLLMLTEIALRFLGLLKIPPGGSTLFYLFGNPKSGGKPSGLGWYAMYRGQ